MMKKKLVSFLFVLILCVLCSLSALAAENSPRLDDQAELLSSSEQEFLLQKLDEISERQQFDVVIVTVNSLDGMSAMDFADDYFDYNGFGQNASYDGALLLVCMEPDNRVSWISTCGFGITAMTDAGIDYMLDIVTSDHLAAGEYYEALDSFADLCDQFVTQAKAGKPYDVGNMPREPLGFMMFLKWVAIAFGVGLLVAVIRISSMKGKMKTVHMKAAATDYLKPGSLNITNSNDLFLYSNVSRVKRETSSSSGGGSRSHTSSSGRSHGGGGRRF